VPERGSYVVAVLKRPLEKAQVRYPGKDQIAVLMSAQPDGTYHLDTNQEAVIQPYARTICAVHFDLINAAQILPWREIGRRPEAERWPSICTWI